MDTASLPDVLIMCLVFSFYMNVYCLLIRAGRVCDYGCVFLYCFQWRTLQFSRIFFHYQDVCTAKIFLRTGEVLSEMQEFSLPKSCIYGTPLMIMWRMMGFGRTVYLGEWAGFVLGFFFSTLSFRKKLCETHSWTSLKGLVCVCVCVFVSILHCIQCFQMGAIMNQNK